MPENTKREKLNFKIRKVKREVWEFYKRYHYLKDSIGSGHYYEVTLKDKRVGFCSIARFPHPKAKDIMTIGRIVIIPEFQGFGIGIKLINRIANLYEGDRIRITTSLKPFMKALNNNHEWMCVRSGRVSVPGERSAIHSKKVGCSVSYNRITATFQYRQSLINSA